VDDDVLRGGGLDDALAVDALTGWDDPPICATWGQLLKQVPEDEPDGAAGLPVYD
jgi:hypothetical protein